MNFCKRFAIALLLAALSSAPAWAGLDEGKAAYDKGDYSTALREWRPLAERGDALARFALGVMYEKGQGVAQDCAEAVRWYRLAAAQGDAGAQLNLGVMYDNGRGVARDYAEAVKWYRLAAVQGDADAQFNLGVMYADGQGVVQDDSEAIKWWRLAASQGHASALNNLGAAYQYGKGVRPSKVAAYALYNLSASVDSSDGNKAAGNRGKISAEMSSAEIEAGQALTRAMVRSGNLLRALDAYLAPKKKR